MTDKVEFNKTKNLGVAINGIKKHPRELKAILSNLNVIQKALCEGANP